MPCYNRPARKGVSGDYYDVFRLEQDKLGIAICDVAGKGIPAAMVMVMIRSITPPDRLPPRGRGGHPDWINRGITGRIDLDHFATIAFLIYDQAKREVLYSNAAHLPLLVYRPAAGKLVQGGHRGAAHRRGEGDARYEQKRFELEKGDILILLARTASWRP